MTYIHMTAKTTAEPTIKPTAESAVETTSTRETTPEVGLLGTLGIEGKLFAAQLVNFAIVAVVLWKFAYKPLLKVMDDRATKIAQGIKDAGLSAEARRLAEEAAAGIMADARAKSKEIMDATEKRAEAERVTATDRAKAEVTKIVEQGKVQITAEKTRMLQEAKEELGTLVALVAEHVIKTKVDATTDARLIATAVAEAEKGL